MKIHVSVVLIVGFCALAFGQAETVSTADKAVIAKLWSDVNAAVQKRDKAVLEQIYAENFTHVHAMGKIDDRSARLATLLSGETTIDTATEVDFGFRKYGETLIAVGTVKMIGVDGKSMSYAVTRVYVKTKGRWRFASSHASPVESK